MAVLVLVVSACGDSGGGGSANTCAGLADDGIDLIQDVLDELRDLSLEDIAALGDSPPAALDDLETRGNALQTKADELNCSSEEMQNLISDRVGSLKANGPFAELILQGIRSEGLFD